jgi:hypothetical protein
MTSGSGYEHLEAGPDPDEDFLLEWGRPARKKCFGVPLAPPDSWYRLSSRQRAIARCGIGTLATLLLTAVVAIVSLSIPRSSSPPLPHTKPVTPEFPGPQSPPQAAQTFSPASDQSQHASSSQGHSPPRSPLLPPPQPPSIHPPLVPPTETFGPSECKWSNYRLPSDVRPHQYDLRFDVDIDTMMVVGSVAIHLENLGEEKRCIILHAAAEVKVNPSSIWASNPWGMSVEGVTPHLSWLSQE